MSKKRIVIALGHKALGTNLPEQKAAVIDTSQIIADLIEKGWQIALVHSNAPQVGMIHTAMNEFSKQHCRPYVCVLCHEPRLYWI